MTPRTCPPSCSCPGRGWLRPGTGPGGRGHSLRRNGQSDGWALGSGVTAVAGPGPPFGGRQRALVLLDGGGRRPPHPVCHTSAHSGWEGPSNAAHYRFDGSTLEELASWDYYDEDYKAVPREGGLDLYSFNPQYEFQFHNPDYSGVPSPASGSIPTFRPSLRKRRYRHGPNLPSHPFLHPCSPAPPGRRRRIRNLFQGPKRRPPVWLMVLVLLLILSCGGLVACQDQKVPPEKAEISALCLRHLPASLQ